jgi:hypothetical protein
MHDECTSKGAAPETVKQQRLPRNISTEGLQDQRAYLMNSAPRKKTDTHATSKRFIMLIYVDHSKQDIVLIQYVITMSHRDLLLRHQKRHKRWPKQLTKSYNAVLPSQNLRTDA